MDHLQHNLRVLVCGPTTLGALLNSLQMGFRTLAIERRASEVWTLLGAVKGEFAKFGQALDSVQKKLGEASAKIDLARRGTKRIERKLKDVEELPAGEAAPLLDVPAIDASDGDQDLR
jgi:DNA recombination protein RmuC